jgi:hypothetical protein
VEAVHFLGGGGGKEPKPTLLIIILCFVLISVTKCRSSNCETVSMIIPLCINNKSDSHTVKDRIVGFEVLNSGNYGVFCLPRLFYIFHVGMAVFNYTLQVKYP